MIINMAQEVKKAIKMNNMGAEVLLKAVFEP